jgi:hypothetical protein
MLCVGYILQPVMFLIYLRFIGFLRMLIAYLSVHISSPILRTTKHYSLNYSTY